MFGPESIICLNTLEKISVIGVKWYIFSSVLTQTFALEAACSLFLEQVGVMMLSW